jgi:hypothetical protein
MAFALPGCEITLNALNTSSGTSSVIILFLLIGTTISFSASGDTIDGKGLLCTCVESRSEPVLQKPVGDRDRATEDLMQELFSEHPINIWQPLKCADQGHAYFLKYTLSDNPKDVDSFFMFKDGSVTEQVLVQSNEMFEYQSILADSKPYSTDIHTISWSAGPYENYVLGRKSLFLARQWEQEEWVEVSQCKVFSDATSFQQAKDAYKTKFKDRYEEAKKQNGNRL